MRLLNHRKKSVLRGTLGETDLMFFFIQDDPRTVSQVTADADTGACSPMATERLRSKQQANFISEIPQPKCGCGKFTDRGSP